VFNSYLQSTPAVSAIATYNKLTVREKEVFNLLRKGYSRSKIAKVLIISPKTVDRHRSNLINKLKLGEEAEILQFAKLVGLTEFD
jgi:two-component system response regulator NreC